MGDLAVTCAIAQRKGSVLKCNDRIVPIHRNTVPVKTEDDVVAAVDSPCLRQRYVISQIVVTRCQVILGEFGRRIDRRPCHIFMRTATILILVVTRRAADGMIGVFGLHRHSLINSHQLCLKLVRVLRNRLHCGTLVDRVAAADVLTGVGVV